MTATTENVKARAIKPGSTIALVAPAGPITEEQLVTVKQKFESMGYRIVYSETILSRKGYMAGEDHTRLEALHKAFSDKNTDMVLCIRGGYGCSRIVDKIDYQLIRQNPKVFMGFSDITILLNAIWQETGLVTFHGIIGKSNFTDYTHKMFHDLITHNTDTFEIQAFDKACLGFINPGKAKGRLAGGNLCNINALIGTKYDIDFRDKIVFLEDIDENPYRVDRMLTQLVQSGKLQKAAGIILGDFSWTNIDLSNPDQVNALSFEEVFRDRLGELEIPILTGFSFGHIDNQAIFPVGALAEMDTEKPFIKLLENVVE